MENRVISMISHLKYNKARLFLPNKPPCQVYHFSKPEPQKQEELTVEDRLDELWDQIVDIQYELMILAGEVEKEGKKS